MQSKTVQSTMADMPLLQSIASPADLKSLAAPQLKQLASELRQLVIKTVDANGGHLGSNLGVVELTIALHLVFEIGRERLLWDVSHQAYIHKLLTGRAPQFSTLRRNGGVSGFTNKMESPFDLFNSGHAGTAVSLATGLSVADRLENRPEKTIVVVGDASFACGVTFEGLNHAGAEKPNLLVILNDNRMSIAQSVGALAQYMSRIKRSSFFRDLCSDIYQALFELPVGRKQLKTVFGRIRLLLKRAFKPGQLFEELGFHYFGPVDGHDLRRLTETLQTVSSFNEPVLLHVTTVKGFGYQPALINPDQYHGCKNFLPANGANGAKKRRTFTDVFAQSLCELGKENDKVCAVTAAMCAGTGVQKFGKEYPDRMFDVGIAEEHGVCFSSGLSFGGRPTVYALYSTFAQRAYDQIFHDVCLQQNEVVFCLDRAGIVGEDGPTHHGVFDIGLLRHLPCIVLAAPRDGDQLRAMLRWALTWPEPVVIRYPKTVAPDPILAEEAAPLQPGRAEIVRRGAGIAVLAYGSMVAEAVQAADMLPAHAVTVVDARFAKPVDTRLLKELAHDHEVLFTVEEHALAGGFGSAVLEELTRESISFAKVVNCGIPDRFIPVGKRHELLAEIGLTASALHRKILEAGSSRLFSARRGKQQRSWGMIKQRRNVAGGIL